MSSGTNIAVGLQRLLAGPALQVGEVVGGSPGAWVIELPGGGRITARGDASLGQQVWVRGGLIEGGAPTLTVVLVDI